MDTQAKDILNLLETQGWQLTEKENPLSKSYWWVWEFWTLKKNDVSFTLTFLIDPQEQKKKETVWAVTATSKEPLDRHEAERGLFLGLGRHWENKLPEFISAITKTNWGQQSDNR